MPISDPTIPVNNGTAQTPVEYPSDAEVSFAFDQARQMAAAGVPIFLAEPAMVNDQWDPKGGTDNCGYWLPKRWQKTVADPAVVDCWRPGVALCAVQGHLTDVLDVDPRNGGSDTCARMNGHWPVFYGRQATPSGGTHDIIAPLRVGSHDGIAPGIDLKGGRPDGSGRGFVFLAPTVKMSKIDNVCRAYRWITPPDLTKLAGSHNDVSGRYFANLVPKTKGSKTTKPENSQSNNDPFFDWSGIFTPEQADKRIRMRLDSVTYHAISGWHGFRDTILPAAYEIGGFVGAGHLTYGEAEEALRQAICYASQPDAQVVPNDKDELWIQQGLEDGAAKPWRIEEVEPTPSHSSANGSRTLADEAIDAVAQANAQAEDNDRRFGVKYFAKLAERGPAIFLAKTLAEDIMEEASLAYGIDDRMWVYREGVWRPEPHIVQNQAAKLLGEQFRTPHAGNTEVIIQSEVPRIACKPVTRYINFRNGLLDWQTGELVPHNPDVFSTIQLPVEWRPDATCLAFDKFLTEVLPPDCIPLVWEVIGYAMYDDNPLHKAIMCMGNGRNGKGTLLRTLGALLGEENVSAVTLQALASERFAASGLFGKLANIAGDIDGTYMESTARFKAITGGDVITAEFKFKDQFEFTPRALPIFSANKIPGSADVTVGYLSRWVVLPFPHSFLGREDRGLDAALSTPAELSGIAYKAVGALWGLLMRGNFQETESSREAFDDFRRRVDQVRSWLHECCQLDPSLPHTPRAQLFTAYQRWAAEAGVGRLKAAEFYDRLEAAGVEAAKVVGVRGFNGIRVVDDPQGAFPWL